MPPKTVTCSVCCQSVLKAQTLARADGSRACRGHDGVQAEAEKLAQMNQQRLTAEVKRGSTPYFMREEHMQIAAERAIAWEREAAEYRSWVHSHCWVCNQEGAQLGEFFADALVAMKRLELRDTKFNFFSMPLEVRKLMHNPNALAPITLKDEVIDRAIIKHLMKRVREMAPIIGQVLLCIPCVDKHGFKRRLDDMLPKPTWEQLENMMGVVAGIDPTLRAIAEKREQQS